MTEQRVSDEEVRRLSCAIPDDVPEEAACDLALDLLDARARCRKMKEALKLLLAYTEQVELLAYDHGERAIKHPVVQQANRALRGEEAGE